MPELALSRARRRTQRPVRMAPRRLRRAGDVDELVVAVMQQHADSVLRLARSVSICDDDANDAYQRALEIFVRNAGRLDPARAASWLRTVTKHEALAIRAQRTNAVAHEAVDLDREPARDLISTEDQIISFDRVARSAEAIRELKPDEIRALWLRAEGFSYEQIAQRCEWTYTKVNRLLAEGRARFLSSYATIEAGEACAAWAPVLSAIVDGESGVEQRRAAGRHLRSCGSCRGTLRGLRATRVELRAVLPVGLVVAGGGGDRGGAHVVRMVEGIFAGAHERVTAGVVKAQVLADALSAGKVAAIAASAAAVAGGGVAAVERVDDVRRPSTARAAHVAATTGTAAAGPSAAAPVAPSAAAGPVAAAADPAAPAPATTTAVARDVAPRAAPRREFNKPASREFDGGAVAASERPSSSPANELASEATSESASGEEFAPAETGRSTGAAAPGSSQGEFAP